MKSRSFCSLLPEPRTSILIRRGYWVLVFTTMILSPFPACARDAPSWMRALTSVAVPSHDDKDSVVQLYSEEILSVGSNGKMKSVRRAAFKILRPDGKIFGLVRADADSETKVTGMRGWCIPTQGKDYEVKEKDSVETALPGVSNGELMSDLRAKILRIPAADPGNIVGSEVEQEVRPYVMQDEWVFQSTVPSREAHYTLQLPSDWEYKATWLNYPETKAVSVGNNQWQWTLADIKAIKAEENMPPWRAVAGQMYISLFPPGGKAQQRGFETWSDLGIWYTGLLKERGNSSPEMKQKVAALTASYPDTLGKMRVLAKFVQSDIRYVAIELGIGGWQPHAAEEVFSNRYGDCKDKATLLGSMLREIGVTSYLVVINTGRGAITPAMPPHKGGFNHAIIAIQLPGTATDPSLAAIVLHPKLGRILFFDPTSESTPFGQLSGYLQENYGLMVGPDGGEFIKLPTLPAAMSGIQRSAKMKMDADGTLQGEVKEVRLGDQGRWQRQALHGASDRKEWVKPVETLLSHSFTNFQLTKASVSNLDRTELPFGYNYEVIAPNYGKRAGNLMLVRPRILGSKSSDLLETKEPRRYSVEFDGPWRDTDSFEITLPPGYEVDDLPPSANADYPFASYHSKTEVNGNVLLYKRTFEVKQLTVPLDKVEDLKRLYRTITGDERNTAVLRPIAK